MKIFGKSEIFIENTRRINGMKICKIPPILIRIASRVRQALPASLAGRIEGMTGRQKKQDEILDVRGRYFLEATHEIYYQIDAEGRFTFINKAIKKLGYEPQELVGRHFSEIIHPADVPQVSRAFVLPEYANKKIGADGQPPLFDERRSFPRHTKDLRLRLIPKGWEKKDESGVKDVSLVSWGVVTAAGYYGGKEKPRFMGTEGIIKDITDAVRRRQAEKVLVEQSKFVAMGEVAAGAAHEIRGLALVAKVTIENLVEALEQIKNLGRGGEGQIRKLLLGIESGIGAVADSLRGINEFTNELMDLGREMAAEQFSSDKQIRFAIKLYASLFILKRVELVTDLAGGELYGPLQDFTHALINLLKNALQATPEGGKVLVSSRIENDRVVVEVSDTGLGMSETTQRRLFDPFYSTKERGEGAGIGMGMVLKAVKAFGGEIKTKTKEGEGTTFTLLLPIKAPLNKERTAEVGEVKQKRSRRKIEKILVVDDEPLIRRIIQAILSREGYQIETAENGEEALKLLQSKQGFDLVITDLVMPGIGGLELIDKIREKDDETLVFCISGGGNESSIQLERTGLIDEIISKPFGQENLVSLIGRYKQSDDGDS
jgi:CheY-like chemotaxis protein/PAS domain-containing protein